ncbi:MAG TPA: O-antigen ligase family protein [Candidatus Fimivivens sp.]|nr:O-antigen ligase family protein [Candidatus Fimivivens sp.]
MNIRTFVPTISMSLIAKSLLLASGVVTTALLILSYVGVSSLGMMDFLFLFLMSTLAAAYRPGWAFLLLVSVLPLEIVNLAPTAIGSAIRPYQFLMITIYAGLAVRLFAQRPLLGWPRLHIGDLFVFLIPIGAVFAIPNAVDRNVSLHLSVILFSFVALYFLFRMYVRTSADVGKILPFLILSAVLTSVWSISQNLLFLSGRESFEVMPGRPNGPFAEADWLGMFLGTACSILITAGYLIASRSTSIREYFRMKRSVYLFLGMTSLFVALIVTMSRSAWLGTAVSVLTAFLLIFISRRRQVGSILLMTIASTGTLALLLVFAVPLTDFDIFGRAASIGSGLQSITVSCERKTALPDTVISTESLALYGCRHIDLDEVDSERTAGRYVTEIDRNDPNVSIRRRIYAHSVSLGFEHPIQGIGWGSITAFLGQDGRGAGLNASNIFLETWLGSGLLGLVGLTGFLIVLAYRSVRDFVMFRGAFSFFMVSSFAGIITFNLFNSGILLGFFWALLGIAGSYLFHESDFSETL